MALESESDEQLTSQANSANTPIPTRNIREWFIENGFIIGSVLVILITVIAVCFVFINQSRLMIIKYGAHDKTPFDYLGSFIGGISLFIGALLVWIEATTISHRNAKIDLDMRKAVLKTERDLREAALNNERIMREAALQNERDIADKEFQLREATLAAEQNNIAKEQYISAVNTFRILYDEFWKEDGAVSKARRWIISEEEYNTTLKPVLLERNETGLHNKLAACKNEKMETIDRFCSILVRIQSLEQWQRDLWVKILHGKFWIDFIEKNRQELHDYLDLHWKEMLASYKIEEEPSPGKAAVVDNGAKVGSSTTCQKHAK